MVGKHPAYFLPAVPVHRPLGGQLHQVAGALDRKRKFTFDLAELPVAHQQLELQQALPGVLVILQRSKGGCIGMPSAPP
jgi:hypothetical protein